MKSLPIMDKGEKGYVAKANSSFIGYHQNRVDRGWMYWLGILVMICSTLLAMSTNSVSALDIPSPPRDGFVLDLTNTITPQDKAKMNRYGLELDKQTKAQVAVLVVPSLDGEPIDDFANKVFRAWGVGDKSKNNGILYVVSLQDKAMRIEVGYGLEGALNDAKAGTLLDTYAVPAFQKGQMSRGILNTYQALVGVVANEYQVQVSGVESKAAPNSQGEAVQINPYMLGGIILVLVVLIFLDMKYWGGTFTQGLMNAIAMIIAMSGRGGGRGGGFGGFGGGSSGGGGANRRW